MRHSALWGKCCFLTLMLTLVLPGHGGAAQKSSAGEVTLKETINATLRTHHSLKAIQENRDVVINELDRAKAGYGPRVDINARSGINQLSNTTTRSLNSEYGFYGAGNVGATLTQPLWDGFATRSRVRTAQATVESMTSRVLDNATTLALDSIIAHIDLLRRRKIYKLAEENVRRHREILASAQERESVGADTLADVTQTQGRLSRAQSTLSEAQAAMLDAEAAYCRLTGLPIPMGLEPVELPLPMYDNTKTVLQEAQKHNPKIAAYQSDVRAAQGEKELAESAYHPVINLEAGPNYSDRGGPGDQWTSSMDIMGTVRWNIFNSGADVAANKAAAGRVRQSRQTLYNLMDDLVQQTENSWTGYTSAKDQYKYYVEAVGFNTKTRDAYLEQFFLGQRSLLDVLDSENELFNSSTQAATAYGNVLVGGYRLFALAGVLLPRLHIDTANLYKTPAPEPEGKPLMDFK